MRQTEPRSDTVQSLTRALSILNELAASERGLNLSETAARTSLAVSTAHRLLHTLQQKNFVHFNQDRGIWTIGLQAFIVGNAFLHVRDLSQTARPIMRELMESSGETVNLAVEDQGEAIYIDQTESFMTMRAIAKPGGRTAMHASGVGKALLANMSEEAVNRILMRHGMPKLTEKTLIEPEKLKRQLTDIREKGYAVDDEENAVGLRCIAAVICDETEKSVGAISLSGPAVRVREDMIAALGDAVKRAAERITLGLGGRPSHHD